MNQLFNQNNLTEYATYLENNIKDNDKDQSFNMGVFKLTVRQRLPILDMTILGKVDDKTYFIGSMVYNNGEATIHQNIVDLLNSVELCKSCNRYHISKYINNPLKPSFSINGYCCQCSLSLLLNYSEDEKCPICLEKLGESGVIKLECLHQLCMQCYCSPKNSMFIDIDECDNECDCFFECYKIKCPMCRTVSACNIFFEGEM